MIDAEPRGEIPRRPGISFFNPGDRVGIRRINPHIREFRSKPKTIMDIGTGVLVGTHDTLSEFEEGVLGFAVQNGKIIKEKAKELEKRGFFVMNIGIVPGISSDFSCQMYVQNEEGVIPQSERVDIDRVEPTSSRIDHWRIEGDDNTYAFFAKPDIQELSGYSFSFVSIQ